MDNNQGLHAKAPELSIIICTYNRADLLQKTLESLLALKGLERAEVIVVDNRSTDHTASVLGQFVEAHGPRLSFRHHYESEQGLSAARNAGIHLAEADLVAFLDDDAIPSRDWITTIVDTFHRHPDMSALGGPIAPIFETERPSWLSGPLELPYTIVNLGPGEREYPKNLNPFGANMAMRKSVFATGMFPLHLGRKGNLLLSGEESWVFENIRKAGGLVIYHPDMAVDHFVPAERLTRDWIMNRYYYQGMSYGAQCSGPKDWALLMAKTGAKLVYIAVSSMRARSEAARLLIQCRMQSIRGTMDTFRNRNRESAAG